jgi:hypothetical protein
MTKPSVTLAVALTLLCLSTACSPKEEGYPRPKIWPKPTEPPPASPVYHDVEEWIPSEEDIAREASEHNALLAGEVERALTTRDLIRRETVFAHIVPELLQVEPRRLVDLHARLEPGAPRDLLRTEIAAQWSGSDPAAAARWMKSLDEDERHAAAVTAVTRLVPLEPDAALALAAELGLGDDEPLRKLLAPLRKPRRDTVPD